MKQDILKKLFRECISRRYKNTVDQVSWDFARRGNELRIYFEPSNGTSDWLHNLNFHAAPYSEMEPPWECHAGFLQCWRSVKPHLASLLADPTVSRILIVGYSHGAALALLCHEFVYYNRPDLRDTLTGIGFGCPRVLYGSVPIAVAQRWERFYVVRNLDDLVTHLPPRILGYCHVGNLITVGKSGTYNAVDAHRPESYLREL
ncbi:MAG: hypothetical protein IJW16_03720 [Clostridia bacterium]|nr:hypothetical protein [Clostridia bacterium]